MDVVRDPCREWRFLASCELDGELSELGAARLRHHLAGCADCARWLAETGAVTGLLRASEPALLEQEIRLPVLRRRLSGASRLVATGASVAAAALAAVLVGLPTGNGPGHSSSGSLPGTFTPGVGCTACTDSTIVLTAFKQASIVPNPAGVTNPFVELD